MTRTTVSKCLALGALGIGFATGLGCHCKSRNSNPFCIRSSQTEYSVSEKQIDHSIVASKPNAQMWTDTTQAPSGLLVGLKNALANRRSIAGPETQNGDSKTTTSGDVKESSVVRTTDDVAKNRPSKIEKPISTGSKSSPAESKSSPAESKSCRRNSTKAAESDANTSSNQEPEKQTSADKKDQLLLKNLKPIAKFEPTSVARQRFSSNSTDSAKTDLTAPKPSRPSSENRSENEAKKFNQASSTSKLDEVSQQPTQLPSALMNQNRLARRDDIDTDKESPRQEINANRNAQDQPLELVLRDGAWPIYGDVDPAARAYEARERAKTQFRDLDSQTLVQNKEEIQKESQSIMRMAGHRRRVDNLDEAAQMHDRSNWVPIENPTRVETGIELKATSGSAHVPVSPIVKMTEGSSESNDHARQNGDRPLQMEMQPLEWPRQSDPHELLPLDDVGPIIDLPVSESIRRLTVRPDSKEEQTVER